MDILILSQCKLKYLLSVVQKKCVCACVRERKRVGEANEAKQMSQTVNSQIQ